MYNTVKYLSPTILLVVFCCRSCNSEQNTQPEVTILQGTLQGATLTTRGGRTISAFLSIPYAQPPIGNLRFANPVAADGWSGPRNATVDGNMCPQASGATNVGEDCLNINVYTPQIPENGSSTLLPVMVWFYGGGFVSGSHESDLFEPEYLLDADVVLAVPNYRLGPLGFLSTGDEVASGNWGLKDQILALEWVQKLVSKGVLAEFLDDFDTLLPEFLQLTHQSDSGTAWVEAIKEYYFNNDLSTDTSQASILTNFTLLATDALYYYPIYDGLKQQFDLAVNPQYFYTFDYVGSLGYSFLFSGGEISTNNLVVHADDVLYLFPQRQYFSLYGVDRSERDYQMVDTMVELWTSFAINGTPTTTANKNTVTWSPYSAEDNYLRIGNGSELGLEVRYSFFKERMEFWAALYAGISTSAAATSYPNFLLALLVGLKFIF